MFAGLPAEPAPLARWPCLVGEIAGARFPRRHNKNRGSDELEDGERSNKRRARTFDPQPARHQHILDYVDTSGVVKGTRGSG